MLEQITIDNTDLVCSSRDRTEEMLQYIESYGVTLQRGTPFSSVTFGFKENGKPGITKFVWRLPEEQEIRAVKYYWETFREANIKNRGKWILITEMKVARYPNEHAAAWAQIQHDREHPGCFSRCVEIGKECWHRKSSMFLGP